MATTQLDVERSRYDDNVAKYSAQQTELNITRQMCAELPTTKARVMFLESLLAGESAPVKTPTSKISEDLPPVPDLT